MVDKFREGTRIQGIGQLNKHKANLMNDAKNQIEQGLLFGKKAPEIIGIITGPLVSMLLYKTTRENLSEKGQQAMIAGHLALYNHLLGLFDLPQVSGDEIRERLASLKK